MSEPLVSVIVLTYNHELFIKPCLEGILSQDYPNFEVIISDDKSVDDTVSIVNEMARTDKRLKFFEASENRGPSKNFAFALNECRGEYIALCEGDDLWINSQKMSLQMEAMMADSELSLIYADYAKVNDLGTELSPKVLAEQPTSFGLREMLQTHGPATNSILLKKAVFPDRFPEVFHTILNPDVFIIGYALAYGRAKYIDRVLSAHREHGQGIWTSVDRFERGLIRYLTMVKFYRSIGERELEKEALRLLERQVILAKEKDRDVFRRFFDELPLRRRWTLGLKWAYARIKGLGN